MLIRNGIFHVKKACLLARIVMDSNLIFFQSVPNKACKSVKGRLDDITQRLVRALVRRVEIMPGLVRGQVRGSPPHICIAYGEHDTRYIYCRSFLLY